MDTDRSKKVRIHYSWSAFESGVKPWNGTAVVIVGSGRTQVDNDTTPWGGPGVDAFLWCELTRASNTTALSLTASSENAGLFGGTGPSVTCQGSAGCCSVVADSQGPCPSCGMCCFVERDLSSGAWFCYVQNSRSKVMRFSTDLFIISPGPERAHKKRQRNQDKTKRGKLPANPWMAAIVGGRCKCVPPQVCDE